MTGKSPLFRQSPADGLPNVFDMAQIASLQQQSAYRPNMPNPHPGHVVTVGGVVISTGNGSAASQAGGATGAAGFSRLNVNGGLVTAIGPPSIAVQTSAYSILNTDDGAIGDVTGGNFAITLPLATTGGGTTLILAATQPYATGNTLTITPSGTDTISGAASLVLSAPWDGLVIVSDGGTRWFVVGRAYGDNAANKVVATPNGTHGIPVVRSLVIPDLPFTGTPSSTTYARGDGTWATVSGALPAATAVGQFLYSVDGATFAPYLPVVDSSGFIVTDAAGNIVVT